MHTIQPIINTKNYDHDDIKMAKQSEQELFVAKLACNKEITCNYQAKNTVTYQEPKTTDPTLNFIMKVKIRQMYTTPKSWK